MDLFEAGFIAAFPHQKYSCAGMHEMVGISPETLLWAWSHLHAYKPEVPLKKLIHCLYFARHYPTRREAATLVTPGVKIEFGGKQFEKDCKMLAFDLRVALPTVRPLL